MNKLSINNKNKQAGFTLIELIVVIVILGILAATALPKFAGLGGDARVAALQAAKGAMSSTAAMAHAKYLANSGAPLANVSFEGSTITFPSATPFTGYPLANTGFAAASGLGTDYVVIAGQADAVTDKAPAVAAKSVAIIPIGIKNTPTATKCYITYTEPTDVNLPPTFSAMPSATDCE